MQDEPDFVSVVDARVLGLQLELDVCLECAGALHAKHWGDPRCDDDDDEAGDESTSKTRLGYFLTSSLFKFLGYILTISLFQITLKIVYFTK